jgi:hypothetical protein
MKVERMPEILNVSILDLSRCQVPINADLVNVNSAKRARIPFWEITVDLTIFGLLVDIAKRNPFNFLCGSGWFARIEKRGVGEEFVGSYLEPSSSLPLSRVQRLRAAPSQATIHI